MMKDSVSDNRQTWWGRFAETETPPWTIALAAALIVGYVAILYISGLIGVGVVILFVPIPAILQDGDLLVRITASGTFAGLTNGIGDLLALGMIYWAVRHSARGQKAFRALVGLESAPLLWLGVATGGATLHILLFELAIHLLDSSPTPRIYSTLFNSPSDWIVIIAVTGFAPVVEEILHRGVFYPAVAARYGVWAGVVASTVVYGAMNIISYGNDWITILRVYAAGILYTLLRAGSKSTWPGIIAFVLLDIYLLVRTALLL
jgi:membrane protease YdiL (CAAX protease family)